jgi:hypothetical protein
MVEIKRTTLFGKLNSIGYESIEGAIISCKLWRNPRRGTTHWLPQWLRLRRAEERPRGLRLGWANPVMFAALLAATFACCAPAQTWTWTTVLPPTNNYPNLLTAVGYGDGRFVAVGHDGLVFSSDGGLTWLRRDSGTSESLLGVCWGGQFVAVGAWGTILGSADGTNWSSVTNVSAYLTGIMYGGGRYVAFGSHSSNSTDYALLVVSTNGATWQEIRTSTKGRFWSICFGADRYWAVGDRWDPATVAFVMSSTNALDWQNVADPGFNVTNTNPYGIAYRDGRHVIVGYTGSANKALLSTNSATWFPVTLGNCYSTWVSVISGASGFLVGSPCGVYSSADGWAWTKQSDFPTAALAYGRGIVVAAGNGVRVSTGHFPAATSTIQRAVAVEFFARTGFRYRIESSTDLTNWADTGHHIEGFGATVVVYFPSE